MIDSPTAYSTHVSIRNRRSHGWAKIEDKTGVVEYEFCEIPASPENSPVIRGMTTSSPVQTRHTEGSWPNEHRLNCRVRRIGPLLTEFIRCNLMPAYSGSLQHATVWSPYDGKFCKVLQLRVHDSSSVPTMGPEPRENLPFMRPRGVHRRAVKWHLTSECANHSREALRPCERASSFIRDQLSMFRLLLRGCGLHGSLINCNVLGPGFQASEWPIPRPSTEQGIAAPFHLLNALLEDTRLCRLASLRQHLPQQKRLTYLNKG
ncbi:hypothetical protein KC364_g91 [Hortaea werneckii]|nr:hypothetical protein KC364_g91 [Hortaea werneckii]